MAPRKYLVIGIVILCPYITDANPWIPKPGKWKFYTDFSYHNKPAFLKNEFTQYIEIEKTIILLNSQINEITLLSSLAKDNSRNDEDRARIEAFKNHRINELNTYIKQLKLAEQYLYYDPKIWDFSNEIEFGYNEFTSYGISTNNSRSKFHSSKNIGIFYKYNLYKKRNLILTIRPNVNFNNNAHLLGFDIIFGSSKDFKKKKIIKGIFQYSSIGFIQSSLGHNLGYKIENTLGNKLPNNFMILLQNTNYIQKNASHIYSNILRKQLKIAREIETPSSKIGINIGYFTTYSISAKKQISSGFSGGIWIEN